MKDQPMTVTRRLFTAGLPAAGMIAATLALSGQAASAAPQDLGFGDAPEVDAARAWLNAVAGSATDQAAPLSPVDLPQEALLGAGAPGNGPLGNGALGNGASGNGPLGLGGPGNGASGNGPLGLGGPGNGASGAGVSGMVSGDNDGILNGTQIAVPIQAPVNVCGTGVGVLGVGFGDANCGPAAAPPPVDEPPVDEPPVDEPPAQEPPTRYGPPELPVTGGPLMGLAGLGGLLTAGGAAMSIAGARVGVGAARYAGRHRSRD
jgi:ChpA-C